MKRLTTSFAVCSFALSQLAAAAVEVSVGGTPITLPAPDGFAPVTEAMEPYFSFSKTFVAPMNVQFAEFLPVEAVAEAARGGQPAPDRKFIVQSSKKLVNRSASKADFHEMIELVKKQNDSILKEAETKVPGLLKKMSEQTGKAAGVDLDLSLNQMIPLPPHDETDRSLAYSMFLKFNVQVGQDKAEVVESVATATFVHLKGKILFFYAYAEKEGLEWSRAAAKKWAAEIVAANPSLGAIAKLEAAPARSGFDWSSVLRTAIIGGVIGAVVGLLGKFFKKKQG